MTAMRFSDLRFKKTSFPKGIQAKVAYGDYELSIVRNTASYGNSQGLYEIGVYKNGCFAELPGITNKGDNVKGFLSETDVTGIMLKLHSISAEKPEKA